MIVVVPRLAPALGIVLVSSLSRPPRRRSPTPPRNRPRRSPWRTLHRAGGVPRGWKFTLPPGDPKTGRELFAKLECNKCHAVKSDFPKTGGAGDVGPELTGMAPTIPPNTSRNRSSIPMRHPRRPGFVGPDGRSIMPDYRDSLTFAELVDLVAYIKSLGGGDHDHHHHEANAPQEQTRGRTRCAWSTGSPAAAATRMARRHRRVVT